MIIIIGSESGYLNLVLRRPPLAKHRVLRNLKPRPPSPFLASQVRISETSPKSQELRWWNPAVTPGLRRSANPRGQAWSFTPAFASVVLS